jgi:hypothetical protein
MLGVRAVQHEIAGMTLTDEEIRWASEILSESLEKNEKETRVKPVFKGSGHPLGNVT